MLDCIMYRYNTCYAFKISPLGRPILYMSMYRLRSSLANYVHCCKRYTADDRCRRSGHVDAVIGGALILTF